MASFRYQDSVDIEEGTQLARQTSISDDAVRESLSSREPSKSFNDTVVGKGLLRAAYIIPLIWCADRISTKPLFLYYTVIDDSRKCFKNDDWTSSLAIRWFLGPLGIAINVACMGTLLMRVGLLKKKYERIIWLLLLLNDLWTYIWAYFPSKKSMLSVTWPNTGVKNFYSANIYLVQYFGTVILMYIVFTRAIRTSATLSKATWAKAAFNLVLYLYGGHVFGGLWYSFAIEKDMDCWMRACKKNYSNCSWDHFFCDSDYNYNYTKLDEMCTTKAHNGTFYDFGIYDDVLKSDIVGVSSSLSKKILYCLRWGLQNLSGFGQNLQVSTDAWENIFVMSITIYGVMLFVFFIGNVQRYLQSETEKSEMKRQKKLEIEQSKFFAKLKEDLQKRIKRYPLDKWEETEGDDFENFFNNLPQDLKKDIKCNLCSDMLQTFGRQNITLLEELCDCVKPVSYTECTYIVRDGEPIDELLFLVQGELKTYSFRSVNIGSTSNVHHRSIINILKEGEYYGKELVAWFQVDPYSCDLPISTKSIQTCTKVDGFSLSADDLKIILIKHHKVVFIQVYWRFIMKKKHQIVENQTST